MTIHDIYKFETHVNYLLASLPTWYSCSQTVNPCAFNFDKHCVSCFSFSSWISGFLLQTELSRISSGIYHVTQTSSHLLRSWSNINFYLDICVFKFLLSFISSRSILISPFYEWHFSFQYDFYKTFITSLIFKFDSIFFIPK